VYLYYIGTEDPAINVDRVSRRAEQGGHFVDAPTVIARYARSMALIKSARNFVYRAYFFDNSGEQPFLIGEQDPSGVLKERVTQPPIWFDNFVR